MNADYFKALSEAEKQILSEYGDMVIQAVKRECLNLAWLHKQPTTFDMMRVDNIKEHQSGDSVPFFEGRDLVGSIVIPDELYVLTRFDRVRIWFRNDSERKEGDHAYKIELTDPNFDTPGVEFTWGLISGIVTLSIQGVEKTHNIRLPQDYSLENLVTLLTEQDVQQFVMMHGCMTQAVRERLEKFGI
jgi:hypothetical protein